MRLTAVAVIIAAAWGGLQGTAQAQAPAVAAVGTTANPQRITQVEGITEYRLANGLRVLLAPDASKPTTTVNITYLVGSRHENYGETGMAHLLEHMVFKGTPSRNNIMQELGKRGMHFNGTTFYDRTNYFETFPANEDNLTWALEMEADRMVNSLVARKDLDTEFSVVRNEMESGENNPAQSLWQRMASTAFDWHNYGKSTIGARTDVENVQIENLQAFYRQYYQPDNAVLLVAGKFDAAATMAQIQRIYGAIPKPTRALPVTYTQDPVQDGPREVTVSRVGDNQLAGVLYHTAAGSHPDAAAVAALSEILAGTPNGRLHKSLVQGKKAVSVSPWNFELAETSYVIFMSELNKDQKLADVRKVMIDSLENIQKTPVTDSELRRAKASLLSEIDKTLNDPEKLAVQLSESMANGDWRLFFVSRDRIEALTPKDVQRVAQNYFKESNRTYGQFVPTKTPDRVTPPAAVNVARLVENYQGRAAVSEGENFDASPANIEKRTLRTRLTSGMKLALTPKKTRGETVSGSLHLSMGDEKNLFGHATTSGLVADLLLRGTAKMNRADIAAKLDELKTQLSISGGGQNVTVRFDTLRKNLPQVLELVRDALLTPTFPAAEFDLVVKENLSQIDNQRNEPQGLGSQAIAQAMDVYSQGDVRASLSFDAMTTRLKAAKLEELKRFHAQFYGADHAELALVGDFDAAAVQTQLQTLFGNWKSKARYERLSSLPRPAKPGETTLQAPDKANAFYLAALPVALKDDMPDYVPLMLANKVLGGGVKSRLFDRLRQKDGISYGAGSGLSISAFEAVGMLKLYAIYAPNNLDKLKTGVREELARLVQDGVTEQELIDAKKSLQEDRKISRAQDASLAAGLASQLNTGRTMAFTEQVDAAIDKASLAEVNAALRKYIEPAKFLHVYAGDYAGVGKKAAEK
jgi:zinc protease